MSDHIAMPDIALVRKLSEPQYSLYPQNTYIYYIHTSKTNHSNPFIYKKVIYLHVTRTEELVQVVFRMRTNGEQADIEQYIQI